MAATNSVNTFAAIVHNEVLLNSKRVGPYALMILFSAIAVMGWIKGPAVALGWATNSDFYIARGLKAFSFLFGLPIFNAIIMGDAVTRDFRLGIDPLIFSRPLSRAQYLLGKFFGNFFVLTCVMAAFPLTQFALQAFDPSKMVVLPVKVLPYITHFFFLVVITQLAFAAFFFMVGALTRNNKIVYLLAVSIYPVFISALVFLLRGTVRGRILFDPFLLNTGPSNNGFGNSADYLNQYVFSYTADMIWNRAGMILAAVVCLTWLYFRFTTADRSTNPSHAVSLGLSTAAVSTPYDSASFQETSREHKRKAVLRETVKTKSSFQKVFFAIFQNEVLLKSKRIAPYFMALLCGGNALLWWGWGPATGRGLAVNSDGFIAGVLPVYSFMTLPLFTALFMADPVYKDFRVGIEPLIFSKPITRAAYLLGKFFGNFFVLVCCQFAFVLTLFVLQLVQKPGVVTQDFRIVPYIKHFFVFVVISHLFLAAFYFAVGVLTRNPKIVYGLGICFYPVYISYQVALLGRLPWRWKLALDPLAMNRGRGFVHTKSAEYLNQLVVIYDADLIINRAMMISIAAICLMIVYKRFTTSERAQKEKFSVLNLSTASERVYYPERSQKPDEYETPRMLLGVVVAEVTRVNKGLRAGLHKLVAAIGIEFQLLSAERSLVVIMPLAIFLSILEVAFYNISPDISHSVAYATNTAQLLLLFLIGIVVFYTGEAMYRDREVKIEPIIWSTPVKNSVLLLSKWLATILLTLFLLTAVALLAIVIQRLRGDMPVDVSAYVRIYGVVLAPGIVLITALVVALNVLLRNKYAAYVIIIGTGVGLFYLYSVGYNHWLYNPFLYQLWRYQDLISARMLVYRLYCLIFAAACLTLAHLLFERRS